MINVKYDSKNAPEKMECEFEGTVPQLSAEISAAIGYVYTVIQAESGDMAAETFQRVMFLSMRPESPVWKLREMSEKE